VSKVNKIYCNSLKDLLLAASRISIYFSWTLLPQGKQVISLYAWYTNGVFINECCYILKARKKNWESNRMWKLSGFRQFNGIFLEVVTAREADAIQIASNSMSCMELQYISGGYSREYKITVAEIDIIV
jgi:hypothetical protein